MAARARGGGGGGAYAVALILVSMFFVISLLMAIIFYTQIEDLKLQAKRASDAKSVYVMPDEENGEPVKELIGRVRAPEHTGARTVVGLMMQENQRLKQMISGQPQATLAGIEGEAKAMGLQGESSLLSAILTLRQTNAFNDDRIDQLTKDLAKAVAEKNQAVAAREELHKSYNQSVATLKQQLESQQGSYEAAMSESSEKIAALTAEIEANNTRRNLLLSQLQSTLSDKSTLADSLQQRLEQILRDTRGDGAVDRRVVADGHIVTIIQENDLVYINLGQPQRIQLGMTFEVFGKDDIIKLDPATSAIERGKATIEIINVSENTSVGRVVRQSRGAAMRVGDKIANVAYDPQAVFKFYVYGDFDVDNTGQATDTDYRRIESMISRWGGVVVKSDQLTYDVDYLVLGDSPAMPEALPPGTIDPEAIARNEAQIKQYQKYQELVAEAKRMSIPILNQNRFLTLVGYYRR